MSGFRTEPITSAVYCYFLRSLYEDREAIQTLELLLQKHVKHTYLTRVFHIMLRSTIANHNFFLPSQVLYFPPHI